MEYFLLKTEFITQSTWMKTCNLLEVPIPLVNLNSNMTQVHVFGQSHLREAEGPHEAPEPLLQCLNPTVPKF